jgi:hypothetical protein
MACPGDGIGLRTMVAQAGRNPAPSWRIDAGTIKVRHTRSGSCAAALLDWRDALLQHLA